MASEALKVFISYTGADLAKHADIVVAQLRRMEWIAIDHRDWAPSGQPSVQACREKVADCAILVLLVAHRYGWVPPATKGGDDRTSITRLEYQWAREMDIPVVPFVAESEAGWDQAAIERLASPEIHQPLEALKAELRDHIVAFFTHKPESISEKLEAGLRDAAARIARQTASVPHRDIVPLKAPHLCNRSQQARLMQHRLKSHLESNVTRPLFMVVHGNANEAHLAFIERTEGTIVPGLVDSGSRRQSLFVHLQALEVAATSDFGARFRPELGSKLQQEFSSDADLLAGLRKLRLRAVVIVLQLCASECTEPHEKALHTLRDYWHAFPDLPPDLLVTCILCVKYDEAPGRGSWLRKLVRRAPNASLVRAAVEKFAAIAAEQSQPHICVLPELQSITRRDIDDWAAQMRDKLCNHVSDAEFRRMFDDGPQLPMDVAIKHLESLLTPHPKFDRVPR